MSTSPLKTRLTLTPDEATKYTKAVTAAINSVPDNYVAGTLKPLAEALHKLGQAKRLLQWTPLKDHGNCWDAVIGSEEAGDGARFSLEYVGTCYRRGRWKLLIEVFGGPKHHDWGCFDDADQPTRWYHVLENAIEEAEAIAAVLVADRMERGSIAGWVPDGEGKEGAGQ